MNPEIYRPGAVLDMPDHTQSVLWPKMAATNITDSQEEAYIKGWQEGVADSHKMLQFCNTPGYSYDDYRSIAWKQQNAHALEMAGMATAEILGYSYGLDAAAELNRHVWHREEED